MNDNYIHIYNRKHMYPNEKPHLSARADKSKIVKLHGPHFLKPHCN